MTHAIIKIYRDPFQFATLPWCADVSFPDDDTMHDFPCWAYNVKTRKSIEEHINAVFPLSKGDTFEIIRGYDH